MQPDPLIAHALELLAPLGKVQSRPMFGGFGLRIDGLFVAIVAMRRLYLKADAANRERFAAAGGERFEYEARGRKVALDYWTVPAQAMDSADAMRPWGRLALDAALRAAASPSRPASTAAPRTRADTRPSGPTKATSRRYR